MPTIENFEHLLSIDQDSIWHPYSAMHSGLPVYHVISAKGVRLKLSDGKQLTFLLESSYLYQLCRSAPMV